MYMGHLAFALAAKRLRPELGLAVLAGAVALLDWVDALNGFLPSPLNQLAGQLIHTIPGALACAATVGLVTWVVGSTIDALVLGGLVLSHLATDWLTSDLDAWPRGPAIGLHLYQSRSLDFLLETTLLGIGWWLYRRSLPADARWRWPSWAMLVLLIAFQAVFDFATRVGA
jgi:hypothetical protein